MYTKITAIVPAYNEEKRITHVLSTLANASLISEVICVNDGSTDSTRAIVQTYQHVRLIDLPVNKGKANAIVEGVRAAKGDIVMLLDADLHGVSDMTVNQMTRPLCAHTCDAVLGYPSGLGLLGPLTGERAYWRKDLLPYLDHVRQKGYGLELALNYLYRHKIVRHVGLKGVSQPPKVAKYALATSINRDIHMYRQLFTEVHEQERPWAYIHGALLKYYYTRMPLAVLLGRNRRQAFIPSVRGLASRQAPKSA